MDDKQGIPDYFGGQTLMITGATGFLGKVLVEKLLRSCPQVAKVYILLRRKRGMEPQQRWNEVTTLPVFDRLKSESPDALQKVVAIECELSQENLGLTEDHINMLRNKVTLFYHSAASVEFHENLTEPLFHNTLGTFRAAQFAKTIKHLERFIYVSTTYCNNNHNHSDIKEKIYPACHDWRVVLKLLETENLALATLKEKLMCGHLNTYTLSKQLAEQIVDEHSAFYPVIIMRPSLVMTSIEEPMKGWTDSMSNVMMAICMGTVCGVIRVILTNPNAQQAYIPVDKAANALLIAPWHAHNRKKTGTEVYNCTLGKDFEIPMQCLYEIGKELLEKYPFDKILWTSGVYQTNNKYLFYILFLLLQLLPAFFLDGILLILGKETRFMKINKKLAYGFFKAFPKMCKKTVSFPNCRYKNLESCLLPDDKKQFTLDMSKYSKKDAIEICYLGFLKYFFKCDMSAKSIARNQRRYSRIVWMDRLVKCFFSFVFLRMLFAYLLN